MNTVSDNSYIDEYNKLKNNQEHIHNQDFSVIKAVDIFSTDQINSIYSIIENTPEENTIIQPWAGHKAWHVPLGKEIEDRINFVAQKYLGDGVFLNGDYSFARYSPSYGHECKLFPHYDTRDSQRITFDIQLKATEDWGIVVEGETFYLNDNEALIFSGTQQMHWREKKKISSDFDMIFCHLQYFPSIPLSINQKEILENRSRFLMEKTGIFSTVD